MAIVKPFTCIICGKTFVTSGELRAHSVEERKNREARRKVSYEDIEIKHPGTVATSHVTPTIEVPSEEVDTVDIVNTISDVVETVDDAFTINTLKDELLGMDIPTLKEWGKEHGVDKRKLNNKSLEEAVEIVLENMDKD